MSDPQPDRLKKKPTRAEPLQPDRPGRGDAAPDDPYEAAAETEARTAEKLKSQSDAALKNVREGYD